MPDNITLPGSGAVVSTDEVGAAQVQRVKFMLGADGVDGGTVGSGNPMPALNYAVGAQFWPGYKAAPSTAVGALSYDPGGALITRGAVTTDEGTFRVNFANTSLEVSLGAVTVSGDIVTGSGFAAADVGYRDYFKIQTDADTLWMPIESVVSDTQIRLAANYAGAASGTGVRALVIPIVAGGGTVTVASGQASLASGTTDQGGAMVSRQIDYAPQVFRARLSISQRIANNETRIGFAEPVIASQPRWFARFRASGTTNTQIICESARNPTTQPSAAETESTTVTLPNGATTAALNDYRVEMLTERVIFYINGVRVAEHSRVMPGQSDVMTASVRSFNTGTPASSTTVVVDFITVKNHNKLEIGVMSEAETIVANAPPLVPFTYSQAGVIAINTDLIVIDCLQFRSLFIQCNSMGTTGVVTVQWSNEPTFAQPITATLLSESGATSTTFNAAVLRVANVMARYCRLRLTTATTAGTTTINVWGAQTSYVPVVTTQPVSGTVTANLGTGSLAAGTNAIGDVGLQYRANATGAAGFVSVLSPATPAAGTVKASAGRLIGAQLQNSSTGLRSVKLFNATAPTLGTTPAAFEIDIPAGGRVDFNLPGGIGFSTAITWSVTSAKGLTDNTATGLAANDVSGAFFFA